MKNDPQITKALNDAQHDIQEYARWLHEVNGSEIMTPREKAEEAKKIIGKFMPMCLRGLVQDIDMNL